MAKLALARWITVGIVASWHRGIVNSNVCVRAFYLVCCWCSVMAAHSPACSVVLQRPSQVRLLDIVGAAAGLNEKGTSVAVATAFGADSKEPANCENCDDSTMASKAPPNAAARTVQRIFAALAGKKPTLQRCLSFTVSSRSPRRRRNLACQRHRPIRPHTTCVAAGASCQID